MYSNGLSEVILGKAIKQLKLPRDEIVVMTKVSPSLSLYARLFLWQVNQQLYNTVARDYGTNMIVVGGNPDEMGYVNQHGLSRKVRPWNSHDASSRKLQFNSIRRVQHIFQAVKHSLERLQLDYVDLLQCK